MSTRRQGRPRKKSRKSPQQHVPQPPTQLDTTSDAPETSTAQEPSRPNRQMGSISDYESDIGLDEETDEECEDGEFPDLDDEDIGVKFALMAMERDPKDTDWIPPDLVRKVRAVKGWLVANVYCIKTQ
jgi:hypothetical protein